MIGILVVSHNRKIAEGVCELAAEMTQGKVPLIPVGGTAGGESGTDVTAIVDALNTLLGQVDEVLVLGDLGSAFLGVRTALEFIAPEQAQRVVVSHAPLVEGAVIAAVEAAVGRSARDAESAAQQALTVTKSF
uniref:phosphoenolpyruvate--glycerone phosphotransferase n=1 Tax=Thermomicrobium roseum TaxID=500 RepID=A0A7C5VUR0_THERO